MTGTAGTVAVVILLGLPLAAVWVAGRWRDPPRERWGPGERRLAQAANDPELARHRHRVELGLAGEREWTAARRAVARGTEAPPELRAAVRRLAAERIGRLDAVLARPLRSTLLETAGLVATVVGGIVVWVVWQKSVGLIMGTYSAVIAVGQSRWMLRRRRDRAAAALAANA